MNNIKNTSKGKNILFLTLAISILAVYIIGLFPETTVDSAKYAAVSREIFETGDFIHLKIHGEPYLQKPPLLFWLGAIFFKIFGVSIVVFKLPNLLFTFLGIYSTYRLGSLIFDKRTGLIAAVMYSSSEALFLYNMDVHTDALLTSNIIFAIWQLAEYLDKRKAWNFILGFTGVGLAMISKGVIGLVVPVIAVAGYLIAKRDFRTMFSVRWLAGMPLLFIILYPTFRGLYDQFGIEGLKFYFWSNIIDRIRGEYTTGGPDYFFSLHTFAYIYVPWSLYTYTAFVKDFRMWRENRFRITNAKTVYCYSVIIVLALIVTVSSQQSPHYILPLIPLSSIITARLITDVSFSDLHPKTYKWMLVFRNILIALMWPMALVMVVYFFPAGSLLIWMPILFLLLLLVYSFLRLKTRIQKLIIPLLITILAVSFVSNANYMPSALKYHGPIQASYLYNRIADDSSILYTYDYGMYETYFYPKNISGIVYKEELGNILSKGSCWFITTESGFNDIKSIDQEIITEQYLFPYKKLTNLSLKFLNPKTRESSLQKIYLLKIR